MFVLGGELSSRFECQELDVGGAVHVIRSRNRLRHENASGRAFQFPQCPPKAEFAVWRDEFFWCRHSCLPFLYIELTHKSRPTVVLCVVLGGIDRMPADIRNFFGGKQSQGSQSQSTPAKKDVVWVSSSYFGHLFRPFPRLSSLSSSTNPTDALTTKCSLIGVSHVYRVVRSARSKPEALAGSLMILTMKTTTRSEWERNGPAE